MRMPSAWDFISDDSTELDNFSFFQSVTTSTLAEFFDPGFWSNQLLRFAHHYPALWHGMTALACLHRDYVDHDVRFTPAGEREIRSKKFALKQYNKSIQALSELCSKPVLSLEDRIVVLATCAIFSSMCVLQSLQHQAYMHIRNGLKIISEWEVDYQEVTVCGDYVAASMLVLIFTRLDSQVIPYMFACAQSKTWIDRQVVPLYAHATFLTLFDAYVSIEAIYNGVIRLVWKFNKRGADYCSISVAEREAQLQLLQAWDIQLDIVLETMPADARDSKAVDLLLARRALAGLFYHVDLSPGELASDFHLAESLQLVERVARILGDVGDGHLQRIKAAYTLETGIVEPLFWVAVRCREPQVRHRALRLLRQYPRREGICDGVVAARTVEKVIEIEETGCPRARGDPNKASPCSDGQWVCENHRVTTWDFVLQSESQVAVMYKTVEDFALNRPGTRVLYSWW
ncbi:hypothetical protein BO86DRAFT_1071 [Aspergillus japonicus CBS 114.51]|uniref:C6 zinc finger domain protein n=1 Tax=Aspergillus japonicus CBS 114.51 TaxID=1448312 RepID=A0A8T8XIK3_ASPJA|nr:hypothetical protein BO86DRAFT_1071 [Aspergillus japonicus CBS 114.51]RAH87322.1 hypothetical protein BO86DRAFT_1071 [Aspergillus japonicus CBS 114.51]